MSQKLVVILVMTFSVCSLVGCISDAEKKARTDNAYDVSGEYATTKGAGSDASMKITVRNKSGRSDVGVVVTRESAQEPQEAEFLKAHGIDPVAVASHFGTSLNLDNGDHYDLTGGTNHSDDFGASDTFYICSDDFRVDSTHTLSYCLRGTLRKDDYVLRGTLTLNLSTEKQTTYLDGSKGKSTDLSSVALNYTSAVNKSFFEQYFGTWSGDLNPRIFGPSNDLKGSEVLTIVKAASGFVVQPVKTTITVDGQVYNYVAHAQGLDETKNMSVPLIEVLYAGQNGDRVVLFCQVYSLGKMTGSVVLIKGNDQTQLASFALIHQ